MPHYAPILGFMIAQAIHGSALISAILGLKTHAKKLVAYAVSSFDNILVSKIAIYYGI